MSQLIHLFPAYRCTAPCVLQGCEGTQFQPGLLYIGGRPGLPVVLGTVPSKGGFQQHLGPTGTAITYYNNTIQNKGKEKNVL